MGDTYGGGWLDPDPSADQLLDALLTAKIEAAGVPQVASSVAQTADAVAKVVSHIVRTNHVEDPGPFEIEFAPVEERFVQGLFVSAALSHGYRVRLMSILVDMWGVLAGPGKLNQDPEVHNLVFEQLEQILSATRDEIINLRRLAEPVRPVETRRRVDDDLEALHDTLQLRSRVLTTDRLVDEASESASSAAGYAESAQRSAGSTGTNELSRHFSDLATSMYKRANFWQGVSAVVGVGAVVLAWIFIAGEPELGASSILQKLSVGIPLGAAFGIATYEASNRRSNAQWCEHVSVQLKSLDAFVAPLTSADASEIRRALAAAILSGAPDFQSRKSPPPTDLVDAQRLLDTAIAQLGPRS